MLDENKLNLGYGLTIKLKSNIFKFKDIGEVENIKNLFSELYEDVQKDNAGIDIFLEMFEKILKGSGTTKALMKLMYKVRNKDYTTFENNINIIKASGDDFVEYFLSNLNLIKDFSKLKNISPNQINENLITLSNRAGELLERKIMLADDRRMLTKLKKYLEEYTKGQNDLKKFQDKVLELSNALSYYKTRKQILSKVKNNQLKQNLHKLRSHLKKHVVLSPK